MRIIDLSADVCSSDLRGADRDRHVGVAVPAQVTDRARVHVSLDRLQLANDLQRADLGRAADRAGRKRRAQHVDVAQPFAKRAGDLAHDVHDVAVALDHELLTDLHAARSDEHTSELQSLMRISYAVFCLKQKMKLYNQKPTLSAPHTQRD